MIAEVVEDEDAVVIRQHIARPQPTKAGPGLFAGSSSRGDPPLRRREQPAASRRLLAGLGIVTNGRVSAGATRPPLGAPPIWVSGWKSESHPTHPRSCARQADGTPRTRWRAPAPRAGGDESLALAHRQPSISRQIVRRVDDAQLSERRANESRHLSCAPRSRRRRLPRQPGRDGCLENACRPDSRRERRRLRAAAGDGQPLSFSASSMWGGSTRFRLQIRMIKRCEQFGAPRAKRLAKASATDATHASPVTD